MEPFIEGKRVGLGTVVQGEASRRQQGLPTILANQTLFFDLKADKKIRLCGFRYLALGALHQLRV